MVKKETINVNGTKIAVITTKEDDYISLTDMAGYKDELEARVVVSNWMSTRFTLEFLGIWEQIYNPNFNRMEFHTIKNADGRLVLTPKRWVERTNVIGIFSKSGRYGGGIFAHKDIAFEFGSWLSAEFKFYLIKEFQRLKEDELRQKSLEWNLQRTLSKINYRIHTDAIKEHIIPNIVTKEQIAYTYAEEADLLNVALFGMTAKQWRDANPDLKGNIRDYATLKQLVVLSNMESINTLLIQQQLTQGERLVQLNQVAITQMRSLVENKNLKQLK
ncbi:MAG: KilA-N domain-containing protein [Paludibacter sp.]|nr:KilA-N domain-containing protein [Paludibacter sp.]